MLRPALACVAAPWLFAQEGLPSLAELRAVKVSVATRLQQRPEEAPSLVTVLTRAEIEAYGCEDLADILRLLPGYELGLDVVGIATVSARGLWVHEGKVLVMVDGIPINDLGYGNLNVLGAFPAALVDRVEALRGPGGAVHGQFAEAGVIQIQTRDPREAGARATAYLASQGRGVSGGGLAVEGGGELTTGVRGMAALGYLQTSLSRRPFQDFSGGSLDQEGAPGRRRFQIRLSELQAGSLRVRYQGLLQRYYGQDGFTTVVPRVNGVYTEAMEFRQETLLIGYTKALGPVWRLESTLDFTEGNPIATGTNPASLLLASGPNASVELARRRAEATFIRESAGLAFVLGGGGTQDEARGLTNTNEPGLQADAGFDYRERMRTSSLFLHAQGTAQLGAWGLTAGARSEWTSFGAALAPRLGLTWVGEAWNAKLLYGQAYRIPQPWQAYSRYFAYAGDLRPETSRTVEFEAGRRVGEGSLRASLFRVDVRDPITYNGDGNRYFNSGRTVSEGVEAEWRGRAGPATFYLRGSLQRPGGGTSAGFLDGREDRFIGLAPWLLGGGLILPLGRVQLGPSFNWVGPKEAQTAASAATNGALRETSPEPARLLLNLATRWRPGPEGLACSLILRNLGGTPYRLVQPYYGGHAPLPALDRQVRVEVGWRW